MKKKKQARENYSKVEKYVLKVFTLHHLTAMITKGNPHTVKPKHTIHAIFEFLLLATMKQLRMY